MIELAVSEVRQWTFCPRVLWHRRAMPQRTAETPKMRLGAQAEAALERLEKRRTSRRYGLDGARRHFSVPLSSERLGVRGVCDLVLEAAAASRGSAMGGSAGSTSQEGSGLAFPGTVDATVAVAGGDPGTAPLVGPTKLYPVDVKTTEGGASFHHAVQLAGYALLLEEQHDLPPGAVRLGFVLLLPRDELVPIALDAPLRARFERALADIREMLETERFPAPTRFRGFCPQCEYVHFCGDVL